MTAIANISASVSCHHMSEDYYKRWDALRKYERRTFRDAFRSKDRVKCAAWLRASQKLVMHENTHDTR